MEIGTAVWIKNKHYKSDTDDLWIASTIFKKVRNDLKFIGKEIIQAKSHVFFVGQI